MSVATGHCTLPRTVIKSRFKTDGKYRYVASLNVKWDLALINRTFYERCFEDFNHFIWKRNCTNKTIRYASLIYFLSIILYFIFSPIEKYTSTFSVNSANIVFYIHTKMICHRYYIILASRICFQLSLLTPIKSNTSLLNCLRRTKQDNKLKGRKRFGTTKHSDAH